MALNNYIQQVQLLLGDVVQAKFNFFDLVNYVNTARNQIAAASNSCRFFGAISTTANVRTINFSGFTLPSGFGSVLNVRMITRTTSGANMVKLQQRPFEWFLAYNLSAATVASGPPTTWSQYAQGTSGSIYLDPIPDQAYSLNSDTVCIPSPLALDSDPEVLPYPWTDAVPYYAAYYALLTIQQPQLAQQMFQLYMIYVKNAQAMANPTVTPEIYPGHDGAKLAAMATPVTGATGASAPQSGGG